MSKAATTWAKKAKAESRSDKRALLALAALHPDGSAQFSPHPKDLFDVSGLASKAFEKSAQRLRADGLIERHLCFRDGVRRYEYRLHLSSNTRVNTADANREEQQGDLFEAPL